MYKPGPHQHCHRGESGLAVRLAVVRDVKEKAKANPYTSAYTVAESCLDSQPKVPNQRPVQYLGRIGNHHRQKSRPRHPIDLQFELQMEYIPPEIEIHDGLVGPQRHLIFCTENQLRLLAKARTWYVDDTFHVVKRPFTQLWSIHAFVRVNETMKKLPLMFCLMSARRACDYRAVLELVLVKIQAAGLNLRVECVVSDFEAALWSAVRRILPQVDIRGCAFHWGQAVWRKMQALGLQTANHNEQTFHMYCRQLLALPCLPWASIDGMLA